MMRTVMSESLKGIVQQNYTLFHEEFHKGADFVSVAPGRINIIGDHTDYNLGLAMPAGIDRWVLISFARRNDDHINIKSLNFNSQFSFSLERTPVLNESWQRYVFGAIAIFKELNQINAGFDALIWGNVPLGSGVSSSAALEVAMMNGLRALYETNIDDLLLVKLCQKIEHDFLGLRSGLLDQYASQFSQAGKVMVLDFKFLRHQYVESDMQDLVWVLVDSRVRRELAHSGYSERVKETSDALFFLKDKISNINDFRDLKEEYLELLPNEIWRKRLRHYLSENRRVVEAMDCIQRKDFESLGQVLLQSHQSLRDDYQVSIPQIDFLVEAAMKASALGSRIMGGGFGGCTLNLVPKSSIKAFSEQIKKSYSDTYNLDPEVETFSIVEGASIHRF